MKISQLLKMMISTSDRVDKLKMEISTFSFNLFKFYENEKSNEKPQNSERMKNMRYAWRSWSCKFTKMSRDFKENLTKIRQTQPCVFLRIEKDEIWDFYFWFDHQKREEFCCLGSFSIPQDHIVECAHVLLAVVVSFYRLSNAYCFDFFSISPRRFLLELRSICSKRR